MSEQCDKCNGTGVLRTRLTATTRGATTIWVQEGGSEPDVLLRRAARVNAEAVKDMQEGWFRFTRSQWVEMRDAVDHYLDALNEVEKP